MQNESAVQPDFLTVPQVAQRLQLGTAKVYGMAKSKALPSVRIGGSIRIPRPALERWINRQGEQDQQLIGR